MVKAVRKSVVPNSFDKNALVQSCTTQLEHASTCKSVACTPACGKMKLAIDHVNKCRQNERMKCIPCRQLFALSCHHARSCTLARCEVPFCMKLRQKMHSLPPRSGHQQVPAPYEEDDLEKVEHIERIMGALVHASKCQDEVPRTCFSDSCRKMRRIIAHACQCERRHDNGCLVCSQLVKLACSHAAQCHDDQCRVPWCVKLRAARDEKRRAEKEKNTASLKALLAPGQSLCQDTPR